MKRKLDDAATALDELATAIRASFADDRPINQIWGWNLSPLTRHELAEVPARLAGRLRALAESAVPKELEFALSQVPSRVAWMKANAVPNLPGAGAQHVVPQIFEFVSWLERTLPPPLPPKVSVDWKEVSSKSLLPPELLRRLRGVEASLKAIEPRAANVTQQVETIESAHAAAENLPTDLATLEEARAEVEAARGTVKEAATEVENALKEVVSAGERIAAREQEAEQLVKNCGEAYRVTTTKGLAAAFDNRAFWLNISVIFWVVGLLAALSIAAYLALERLKVFRAL